MSNRWSSSSVSLTRIMLCHSEVLGDTHPDSIITRHNLAELFLAMGDETSAAEIQEHLLELLDVDLAEMEEVQEQQEVRVDKSAAELAETQHEEQKELQYLNSPQSSKTPHRQQPFTPHGATSEPLTAAQLTALDTDTNEMCGFEDAPKPVVSAPPLTFATRKRKPLPSK